MPFDNRRLVSLYRGDNRDMNQVLSDGGFLPSFLVEDHSGGLDGFIQCKNRIHCYIGCSCSGFSEGEMFKKARQEFLAVLADPSPLLTHVFGNLGGQKTVRYVSTSMNPKEAFDRNTKFFISALVYELSFDEARQHFLKGASLKSRNVFGQNKIKVYVDSEVLNTCDTIAMLQPLSSSTEGSQEVSFFTPILGNYGISE